MSLEAKDLLALALSGAFQYNLSSAAATTLLVWDILLTFSQEIESVWKSQISLVKVMFFILRYFALFLECITITINSGTFQTTERICKAYIWFRGIGSTLTTAVAQLLFIYRVLAFYGGNKALKVILVSLFLAINIAIIVLEVFGLLKYELIPNPVPSLNPILNSCITVNYPRAIAYLWIPELIFQSVIFFLVIVKFCMAQIPIWYQRQTSLIYIVFMRDGIWVYITQFIVLFFCVFYNHTASFTGLSFIIWQNAIISVCCNRMILNLRSTGSVSPGDGTHDTNNSSSMQFGHKPSHETQALTGADTGIELSVITSTH